MVAFLKAVLINSNCGFTVYKLGFVPNNNRDEVTNKGAIKFALRNKLTTKLATFKEE